MVCRLTHVLPGLVWLLCCSMSQLGHHKPSKFESLQAHQEFGPDYGVLDVLYVLTEAARV